MFLVIPLMNSCSTEINLFDQVWTAIHLGLMKNANWDYRMSAAINSLYFTSTVGFHSEGYDCFQAQHMLPTGKCLCGGYSNKHPFFSLLMITEAYLEERSCKEIHLCRWFFKVFSPNSVRCTLFAKEVVRAVHWSLISCVPSDCCHGFGFWEALGYINVENERYDSNIVW